jgi:hypothetical protein
MGNALRRSARFDLPLWTTGLPLSSPVGSAAFPKNARKYPHETALHETPCMKRIVLILLVIAAAGSAGCADPGPELVAKINAAYHTRFFVAMPDDIAASPR